jgi:predicted nucleic acid-binding Zn finger protein
MTTEQIVPERDRRESRGRVIALSRTVFHITGKNVYYVESETEDGVYYYIMWNTDDDVEWCSCVDHSMRGKRCKHIFAIEYAIRGNTVKETDKLPSYKKVNNQVQIMDYQKEDYSF